MTLLRSLAGHAEKEKQGSRWNDCPVQDRHRPQTATTRNVHATAAAANQKVGISMSNWQESARRVGAWVRGGSWLPGHDVAFWVGTDKVSARDFAKEAGLAENTIQKYLATWWWAAQDGVVPHAAELSANAAYDFGDLTQEDWAAYYRTACLNPPPWNPKGRPLEPRTGADRHVAKSQAELTPARIWDAVLSDPKNARAAAEALNTRNRKAIERIRATGRKAAQDADVVDWKPSAGGRSELEIAADAMAEIGTVADEAVAIRDLVNEAKERLDTLVEKQGAVGDEFIVEVLGHVSDLAIDISSTAISLTLDQQEA